MKNKIVLITGATSGVGKETARNLLIKEAELILLARNMEKAESVRKDLMATTGSSKIHLIECDLADLRQVNDAVNEVLKNFDRLDVLINNAGAIYPDRALSHDGFEMTFAVNHLAHFLLTTGLLGLIKNTPGSRIINVSSEAHRSGKLDFDDLMWEKRKFSSFKVYSDAKLCNLYFTYELASRLETFGIPVNALHPGVVRSSFGSLFKGMIGFLFSLARPFMIGPVKGAETSVYLATDDKVSSVTSKYFKKKKPVASSPISYDKDIARKLWEISERLVSVQ
jgi:NAD(P)-dependent dehydrogenase (short-subunit alcohol dehydrogenase family)